MTDDLVWAEVPDPQPGPDEVLVEVAAAGVNRADLLQVQGLYPPPPGAPAYLGMECPGVVTAGRAGEPSSLAARAGADTGPWRAGQEVCALLAGGGYAERVAVPIGQVLPVPAGVSLVDAAALPEVACTVWSNLTQVAGLRKGETVLIHGGGSGIGTFAIQYAKALGAQVVTTASKDKHDTLRKLGADVTLDYREEDFTGVPADVILDIIGGAYLAKNVAALATGGRLVIIGLQGGRRAELDLGALLAKRATVAGTTLRSRPVRDKAAIVEGVRAEVWPLIERGDIRPVIDSRVPVERAEQAHQRMASSVHIGKILLTVSPSTETRSSGRGARAHASG